MRLISRCGLRLGRVASVSITLFATAGLAAPAADSPLPTMNPKALSSFTAVMMWHDVVPSHKEVWFDTTVAEIERQFAAIKRSHETPITMEALADHLEKGAPVPPHAVVLSFDDNNLGLYRNLYPILKRYRWPATFFVHTDYVGKPTGKEHCTWEQLGEMEKSGLVKAYPHTCSHPADMRKINDRQLQHEVVDSRKAIEKHLGGARPFFCYSNGFYDDRVARATARAGYRLAITEDHGPAERSPNLMMVRRYSMHRRADEAIAAAARSRH